MIVKLAKLTPMNIYGVRYLHCKVKTENSLTTSVRSQLIPIGSVMGLGDGMDGMGCYGSSHEQSWTPFQIGDDHSHLPRAQIMS